MKIKKLKAGVAVILCMTGAASLFTGCGQKKIETFDDFITAYNEKTRDNFSAEGSINVDMAMENEGETMDLSILADFDFDLADGNMHGNVKLDGDDSMNMDSSAEYYYVGDENLCYTKDSEGQEGSESLWGYTSDDSILSIAGFANTQLNESMKDVTSIDVGKDVITLKQPLSSLFDSANGSDVMETLNAGDMFSGEDFEKAAEGKFVVSTFDADTLDPISIKSDVINFKTNIEGLVNVDLGFGIDVKFSNFGKIKAEDVTVSEEIKSSAINADEESESDFSFDGEITEDDITVNEVPTSSDDESSDGESENSFSFDGEITEDDITIKEVPTSSDDFD